MSATNINLLQLPYTMPGKLYGVGVGPGDPELLTLRALRVLEEVDTLIAPDSGRHGIALEIVRKATRREHRVLRLSFPMTKEREVLEEAWRRATEQVYRALSRGDAAFITLGDPMFYSTFSYVLEGIRERYPEVEVEVVPGVSSLSACAASLGVPLVSGGERLAVVPAAYGIEELESLARSFDTVVLMKVSRRFDEIAEKIARAGLEHKATVAVRCGSRGFTSGSLREVGEVEYLSMIILRGLRE